MSDAPERIWACPKSSSGPKWWHSDGPERGFTEYVRADLVTPPQITEAMVEAARSVPKGHFINADDWMRAALAAAMGVKP